jgi:diguanylate cyclase (GGDEF)-like protein/PAS domain S-box-containing protein
MVCRLIAHDDERGAADRTPPAVNLAPLRPIHWGDVSDARAISRHLADGLAVPSQRARRRAVERVLRDRTLLSIVTQPIVDLATGRPVAWEALARFAAEPRQGPDVWFAQAREAGQGPLLEALALRAALAAPGRPRGARLSVNLSPSALVAEPVLAELPLDLAGLIVEVTEHELAKDVGELPAALRRLRDRGALIAVDDAGTGYAGLEHLLELTPDVIKLDRALVTGVDEDGDRAALVEAFVAFARRTGAQLCAEGIETPTQLQVLADLDVGWGQGWCLARPAPGWPDVGAEARRVCVAAGEQALSGFRDRAARTGEEALQQVSRRLHAADAGADLDQLAADMLRVLHADEIAVSTLAEDGRTLRTVAASHPDDIDESYALEDFPASARALRTGTAAQLTVGDPEADPAEVSLLLGFGHRSLLLVPIREGDRPVGLLEAYSRQDRHWTRTEVGRARTLALHLGPCLARRGVTAVGRDQAALAAIVDDLDGVVFRVDDGGRWAYLSAGWERLTGRPVAEALGRPALDGVDPRDLAALERRLRALAAGRREVVVHEHRFHHASGEVRWARVRSRAWREADGTVRGIVGTITDVSRERRERERRRTEDERLTAVGRAVRAIAAHADARQAICEAAREIGQAGSALLLEPDGQGALVVRAAAGVELPPLAIPLDDDASATVRAFHSGEPLFLGDTLGSPLVVARLRELVGGRAILWQPVRHGDAVAGVLAVCWAEPLTGERPEGAEALALLADEAALAIERADLLERLRVLARTDALTGAANRRVLDEELPRAMARARRDGRPLAVAMLDLDHFKRFNDTHGHAAGDRVLREAAMAWHDRLRDVDLLCRYGGEEFVAVLHDTGAEEAAEVGWRLLGGLREVSASAGVAVLGPLDDPAALLARADGALYAAKAAGRGRVVVAPAAVLL